MNKAVFLDRDGTINTDSGYVYRIQDFKFIEGVRESLLLLQEAGYLLVVISNQSGVARGYYTEDDVVRLHAWMIKTLYSEGIVISGVYYCPHHPRGVIEPYNRDCGCRKPKLELFYRAVRDMDIDIDISFAIGDRVRDLEICGVSGCRGYLLRGTEARARLPASIRAVPDLKAAVDDMFINI
jgi:D-glycero-D-manno-heptose 1,7-bisphosphate phosphatase